MGRRRTPLFPILPKKVSSYDATGSSSISSMLHQTLLAKRELSLSLPLSSKIKGFFEGLSSLVCFSILTTSTADSSQSHSHDAAFGLTRRMTTTSRLYVYVYVYLRRQSYIRAVKYCINKEPFDALFVP